MMTHMCISINGALRNWNKRDFKNLFTRADGYQLSATEAKDYLRYEQAMGKKVLPMGKCDNFDFQSGCRGHEEVK